MIHSIAQECDESLSDDLDGKDLQLIGYLVIRCTCGHCTVTVAALK